jgi:hypothetical protein
MKTRRTVRIAVLIVVSIALFSTWAFVAAADGQTASVSVNSTLPYTKGGVVTVGGQLNCSGFGTVSISGVVHQPIGRKSSIVGSFATVASCGPLSPSLWAAPSVPSSGRFGGGDAIVTGSYNGSIEVRVSAYNPYPPQGNCYYYTFDYQTYSYVYNCYVSGSLGPIEVKLVND